MTPIYNPYIGRQNRPIIKIQRAVSTLVNSDNCGLMPAKLSIFHLFGILANMFLYFCSLHSQYSIVYIVVVVAAFIVFSSLSLCVDGKRFL